MKPGTVRRYREGNLGVDKVLVSDDIYSNSSKGNKASSSALRKATGTAVLSDAVLVMLDKGDIQLTTAERRQMVAQRRREMVNYIHKYFTDPKTKRQIPVTRIEGALDQVKLRVDPQASAESQVEKILRPLKDILPMTKTTLSGTLFIPHSHLGKAFPLVSKWADTGAAKYDAKGAHMEVQVIPGVYDSLMQDLNRATHGNFQFDVY